MNFEGTDLFELTSEVNFNRNLSKGEKKFYLFLISDIENLKKKELKISLKKIQTVTKISNFNALYNFIEKFADKRINYKLYKFKELIAIGNTSIISYFKISYGYLKITFSKDFKDFFLSDSEIKKYNLDIALLLQNKNSIVLYHLFKSYFYQNSEFEISIESLKKQLELEGSYDRFFDFEKIVLKPAIKDIEEKFNKKISYTKIKSELKKSKIIGLSFHIENTYAVQSKNRCNSLMTFIPTKINFNSEKVINLLLKYLDIKDFDFIKSNLFYSIEHYSDEFEVFLENALEFDYYNTRFEEKISKYKNRCEVLEKINIEANSFSNFYSELFKILVQFKYNEITLSSEFIKALQFLRIKGEMEYNEKSIVLIAEYNKTGRSHIYLAKIII